MDWSFSNTLAWSILLFLASLILVLKQRRKRVNTNLLPPGPPAWPILGNIFDIGKLPHRNLYKLRSKYGPVIWLKLGYTNSLVIQSAKAAEHLLKNHDAHFSGRQIPDALTAHNYYQSSLVFAPYGPTWRTLRRLVKLELVTSKKIDETCHVLRVCVDKMIRFIDEDAKGGSSEIELSRYVFVMAFNLMGNLVFSRDLVDSHSEEGAEFVEE